MKRYPMQKTFGLSVCVAVFSALNVLAGYELDTANRILVVTLGSGEEQAFDAQYEDCLTHNQVTNVIKRGNGTLVMGTTDRSAYTGDFTVEAGTLSYAGNNALGSCTSGNLKIFVKNGATLRRKGGSLTGKTVYFEGEGVDGVGALCADSYGDNPWGKSVAMTADALITCNGACSFTYGTTFEMAGHTLRIRQRSNPDSNLGFKGVNFYRLGTRARRARVRSSSSRATAMLRTDAIGRRLAVWEHWFSRTPPVSRFPAYIRRPI